MPEEVTIDPSEVRRLSAEQSNTSILLGEHMVLKLYRQLQPGTHPEVEVGRFLTEVAGFRNTPPMLPGPMPSAPFRPLRMGSARPTAPPPRRSPGAATSASPRSRRLCRSQ